MPTPSGLYTGVLTPCMQSSLETLNDWIWPTTGRVRTKCRPDGGETICSRPFQWQYSHADQQVWLPAWGFLLVLCSNRSPKMHHSFVKWNSFCWFLPLCTVRHSVFWGFDVWCAFVASNQYYIHTYIPFSSWGNLTNWRIAALFRPNALMGGGIIMKMFTRQIEVDNNASSRLPVGLNHTF